MATKKRTKIPPETDGLLLYMTDYRCCVCNKRGDHIHHLDGNPGNNNLDNLAFLCFDDHDLASLKGTLRKKLSKEAIINYRNHHYHVIENRRKNELGAFDKPISKLTEEKLLTVTKNALIILELENIKTKFFPSDWHQRAAIIKDLNKYANHKNNRLSYDIFEFLSLAASQTRNGMPENVASNILGCILSFCPSFYVKQERKQVIELAKQCIHIGENIAYDSFVHLKKIDVAMYGLTIIKFIYREAKRNEIIELKNEVEKSYEELKSTLKRPERNDLEEAQETLKIFYDDLKNWDLALPILSTHLIKRLDKERKENKNNTN